MAVLCPSDQIRPALGYKKLAGVDVSDVFLTELSTTSFNLHFGAVRLVLQQPNVDLSRQSELILHIGVDYVMTNN